MVAFEGMGRLEESLRAFEHSLEMNPRQPFVNDWYGKALTSAGRYQEAVVAFERELQRDSDYVSSLTDMAHALLATGRPDEGFAAIERALRLAPGDCRARSVHARMLLSHGVLLPPS